MLLSPEQGYIDVNPNAMPIGNEEKEVIDKAIEVLARFFCN